MVKVKKMEPDSSQWNQQQVERRQPHVQIQSEHLSEKKEKTVLWGQLIPPLWVNYCSGVSVLGDLQNWIWQSLKQCAVADPDRNRGVGLITSRSPFPPQCCCGYDPLGYLSKQVTKVQKPLNMPCEHLWSLDETLLCFSYITSVSSSITEEDRDL